MIAYAKQLTKNKFARNVAIVASGTAGAQAITIAFSPIITRLYGPEAFGVLGTFTAILAVLTPLAALSYPIAIVLPKRDADALGLVKLSLGIALAMSLLAALILTLFKAPIVHAFNLEAVESFIPLLPLAMLFSVATVVMSQWIIRKKLFKIKAKVAVLQALWLNTAKAGIGLFSPLAAVLVVLATSGNALHAFLLWMGSRGSSVDDYKKEEAKSLALYYKDFPFYQMPQQLLNAVSQSLPVIMLATFYGPEVAGFYALAKTVIMLPSALISTAVADVFFPKFKKVVQHGDDASHVLMKTTAFLALIGILPLATLYLYGELLFSFVFGDGWSQSGVFASWLAFWIFFTFINPPSVKAVIVLRRQNIALLLNAVSIIMRTFALYIGYSSYENPLVSIILFSFVGVLHNVAFIVLAYFSAKLFPCSSQA